MDMHRDTPFAWLYSESRYPDNPYDPSKTVKIRKEGPALLYEGRPYGIWQPGYHSALNALDPMALRPRLSAGLPLSKQSLLRLKVRRVQLTPNLICIA